MSNDLKTLVSDYASLDKPVVAVGLSAHDKEVLESLRRAERYADIVLVGPLQINSISDFDTITDDNPEHRLATLLYKDKVDGIVRGTIDGLETYEAYENMSDEKYTVTPGFLEDPKGRNFFLTPLSNREGWNKEDRYQYAKTTAKFLQKWDVSPKIAIFTGVRHNTYDRTKKDTQQKVSTLLNETYEDAEWIVKSLKQSGYDAKNWTIDLNPAIEAGADLIVPVNGLVGNQIFRTLLFCGGKSLAGPRLGLSRHYEENSRTEKDLEFHVQFLSASINKEKHN